MKQKNTHSIDSLKEALFANEVAYIDEKVIILFTGKIFTCVRTLTNNGYLVTVLAMSNQ